MSDISDSIAKPPVRKLKNAMPETPFKTFSWELQRHFAHVSGDFNPVHMDDVAARRTQAGKAVVHGMHLALWGLDRLIQEEKIVAPLAGFKARFTKMVYVEETASLAVVRDDGTQLTAQVRVGNVVVATLSVTRGPMLSLEASTPHADKEDSGNPVELKLEDLNGKSGTVAFSHAAESLFPAATRALGATRIQAIATISRLVGMVCPGLHSIAYSYQIAFAEGGEGDRALAFQVEEVDERFRLLTQVVWGGGVKGTVVALARVPPVEQRHIGEVAKFVAPEQFRGITALVVGGSRGLGELTAKILAAGGASVVITYAVGHREALAVCEEIRAFGAPPETKQAETMQYDVRLSAATQLKQLRVPPTHVYYFATSAIFRRVDGVFSSAVFEDFCRFYITGFHDLCEQLMKGRREALHVLYPSSVAVAERPAGLTEYAMAKAGGELLCEDLNRAQPLLKIHVARLPRILTDQTATTTDVETADALTTLLPLVQAPLC